MSSSSSWKMPSEIIHPKILIVEGQDEANFFSSFFRYLNVDSTKFHIIDIGGNPKFKSDIPLLTKNSNFWEHTRTIGIIRDAEGLNAKSVFESTNSILNIVGLPQPQEMKKFAPMSSNNISVGIFIMPNCNDEGMFEDLCLRSLPSGFHECYENFALCVEAETIGKPSKSKIQAHLAMKYPLKYSLGHSALSNIWDFSHICFDDIRSFLLSFEQQPI